jgi:hypothetical protein
MTDLTNKELQMLHAIIAGNGSGGTTAEEIKADNMTWFNAKDMVKALGWSAA